jgi:hypothetical protein
MPNMLAVIGTLDVLMVVCSLMAVMALFGLFIDLEVAGRYFNSLKPISLDIPSR